MEQGYELPGICWQDDRVGWARAVNPHSLPRTAKLCWQSLMVSPLVCAGWEQEEAGRREKARLWEMDEDEYDALTEEQKTQFNNNIRQVQQERKRRSVSLAWVTPSDSVPKGFACSGDLF